MMTDPVLPDLTHQFAQTAPPATGGHADGQPQNILYSEVTKGDPSDVRYAKRLSHAQIQAIRSDPHAK